MNPKRGDVCIVLDWVKIKISVRCRALFSSTFCTGRKGYSHTKVELLRDPVQQRVKRKVTPGQENLFGEGILKPQGVKWPSR